MPSLGEPRVAQQEGELGAQFWSLARRDGQVPRSGSASSGGWEIRGMRNYGDSSDKSEE